LEVKMDSLFQNFLRSRGVIPPSSPVDPIATRSYQNISRDVGNVLQQNLPSSFRGAGAQNIPTSILGQVSDIAEMAPGAARERARNQLARNLRMAERGLSPAPTRPAGQGPTGLLRAPSVGNVSPGLNTTLAPRTNIPGSPLATDYALSRQTGMTQALGQARKAGRLGSTGITRSGTGVKVPGMGPLGLVELGLTGIDQLGRAINPDFARKRNIADEYAAKFGADYSLTPEEMAERLGKNDTTTYSSVPGFIGPPVPLVESQRGAWTTKGWDPNAARISPQETPPPAPILPPPESLLPPEERAYQAELARTQQMMASNPYMPQTQLYAQGQSVMQTPEDMALVLQLIVLCMVIN
jgi:hypothetical protein